MATNKNITMKQFNGTDYDTLYPKTIASQIPDVYSKTEVLTTETLSKYGLTADKLPNDVFQQIKTLIDNVQASADSKAKIQTGSYVGTGTYGQNNPCSLTFDFAPKQVYLYNRAPYNGYPILVNNSFYVSPFTCSSSASFTSEEAYTTVVQWEGNSLIWYTTGEGSDADSQHNTLNTEFYYIAFG